jgi:hypothetical protein
VKLRPNVLEIRETCENCERADKNQTESHEIKPVPMKDRAMHEGDNPLF